MIVVQSMNGDLLCMDVSSGFVKYLANLRPAKMFSVSADGKSIALHPADATATITVWSIHDLVTYENTPSVPSSPKLTSRRSIKRMSAQVPPSPILTSRKSMTLLRRQSLNSNPPTPGEKRHSRSSDAKNREVRQSIYSYPYTGRQLLNDSPQSSVIVDKQYSEAGSVTGSATSAGSNLTAGPMLNSLDLNQMSEVL